MMKPAIIFAGYRKWALDIFNAVRSSNSEYSWYNAQCVDELNDLATIESCELIIVAGWSWIVRSDIVERKLVVGLHPSDLPAYAGGSPIQNQILDGITSTKMTLFKLEAEVDRGALIDKCDLSLDGGMETIFAELAKTGTMLINDMMARYPNLSYTVQPSHQIDKQLKRLKPADGQLTKQRYADMTARQIYDFIRCREAPYPNAYLEDETGRVEFSAVKFVVSHHEH